MAPSAFVRGRRYNIDRRVSIFPKIIAELFPCYNRLKQFNLVVPLVTGIGLSVTFIKFDPIRRSANVTFEGEITDGECTMKVTGELHHPVGGWLVVSAK